MTSSSAPPLASVVVHLTPVLGVFATRLQRAAQTVRLRLGLGWVVVDGSARVHPGVPEPGTDKVVSLATHWLPWPLRPAFAVVRMTCCTAHRASTCRPWMIHCHGVAMLAAAVLCAWRTRAPLLYDAHELETDAGQRGWQRRFDQWQERLLIHRADAVVVVSDSIADWYAEKYGIRRPTVVRNIPSISGSAPAAPNPRLWRDRFGIDDDAVIFIYQGKLTRGRRIEQLLRVFARAGLGRHIVFMGFGDLEPLVRKAAIEHANIHYAEAVPQEAVLSHTAGADVGIHGGENICLSYYYSLPNKFFEYLTAGLGVMVPDWPEVGRIVREHGAGWVVEGDDDDDWVRAVTSLSWDDVRERKQKARQASGNFSWSTEAEKLLQAYQEALRLRSRK